MTVPAKKKALPKSQWLELQEVSPMGFTPAFTASMECQEKQQRKGTKEKLGFTMVVEDCVFQSYYALDSTSCQNYQLFTFYCVCWTHTQIHSKIISNILFASDVANITITHVQTNPDTLVTGLTRVQPTAIPTVQ